MNYKHIISQLPYNKPFLFVDTIEQIDTNGVTGGYTFAADADFYNGHFTNNPITPGVLLTECCAQIGLVCLGIYLLQQEKEEFAQVAIGMSSSEMEFLVPVLPNETVRVTSQKTYFRFGKLKCSVKMHNSRGVLVCKGTLSGMIKNQHG